MSQDICFQFRDTGSCRFGASCKFNHGDAGSIGPAPRPGAAPAFGGGGGDRRRGRNDRRRNGRKRSRSRDRDRGRGGGRRRRSRSRDRGRRGRSGSPDPFGRDVRRRSSSIEREEAGRAEIRRQQELKKQEEAKRRREMEKERKREMRELTSTAKWDGEGPRPPGTDLGEYRHDKDMGYVAKNKCWIYTPDPQQWYQKRTGRYYVYDRHSHSYVYSHGGTDPSAPQIETQKEVESQMTAVPVITTVFSPTKEKEEKRIEEPPPPVELVHTASESWAGRKETLEDRYTESERIGDLGMFYGLYDGHGGQACAEHASKRMHKHLATAWTRRRNSSASEAKLVGEAFQEAFLACDNEYIKISQKKGAEDGSTAVCALLAGELDGKEPPRLYTANLGDSRAILCRGGEAVQLTHDHKPNDRDEKKRIEGCGGKVVQIGSVWRVTKRDVTNRPTVKVFLSTSRSLGDRPLKIPDPLVSGVPDIKMLRLSPNDLFLCLVCDGVTDVMSDQEVVDVACDHLHDVESAAKMVVKAAYKKQSKDNLTATVVRFTWQCDQAEAAVKKYRQARRAKEEEEERKKQEAKEKAEEDEEDFDMFA